MYIDMQGRSRVRVWGGGVSHKDLKKHYILMVSSVKLRDLHLFSMCSKAFSYVGGPTAGCTYRYYSFLEYISYIK